MARAGDVTENPVTGERVTFVRTATDTGGELLELELVWTGQGLRVPEHIHPGMDETFTVIEGAARVSVDGVEHTLGPGESVTVPKGTPHISWNPEPVEARLRVEFRPALRWEDFVERLFALARRGRTEERGVPEPALMAEPLRDFSREIAAPLL
jgi:quercetin dioxygenase-like cupin family protein